MEENMKKILALSVVFSLMACMGAFARVQYDSTGRYIIQDNTIRAQKRAAQNTNIRANRASVSAAAKINYESSSEKAPSTLKSNYPQRKK